ncbi:SRPBCC family protein [Ruania halotolerans]|uniref:SRPBCC family protein n=1 Tax=Ruania halotolerans TaxID=2897773 RepID=UPI001E3DC865|nr:SRPBCC family protein [Ruania halotolerans]UFU08353.1 SRPBCC family protein [Ruania halotolerans]
MSEQTSVTVSRVIDAPAADVFDALTKVENHERIDGSGFVRSLDQGDRITATGQVFTMNMEGDHMGGEYQTDNHVVGYDKDKLVAWKTAPAGTEPPGWQWVWELTPTDQGHTEAQLTYDWSHVTDKDLLKKIHFPLVKEEDLEASLGNLAAISLTG